MRRLPRRLQRQIDAMEPAIRDAFLASIADVRSSAQLSAIAGHLARGDIAAAVLAVGIVPGFFAPLDDALRAAYLMGGRDAIAALPAITDPFPGRG
jgi:hypothetical protein